MLISGEHLQNIFASQELDKDSVVRIFRNTAEDGKQYSTQLYNLDAIIAVGYRVNSNIFQSVGYKNFERFYHQRICIE